MRKVIEAQEGRVLTNGKVYGRIIYLAEGESGEDFYEISESDIPNLDESAEEAEIEDYKIALSKLGVIDDE